MISLKADFDPLIKDYLVIEKQVPFAIARTLTGVAQAGQTASRAEIKSAGFHLRNDWTVRNIRITPATKQKLQSEVFSDTSNRKTGAPDYLLGQEEGKERVPIMGRKFIAIPTRYLIQLKGGDERPTPDWLRPRNLIHIAAMGGKYVNRHGNIRPANAQTKEYFFFLVTFKSGTKGLMCRHIHDPKNAALPLYIFVTHAHITKKLHMAEAVEKAVDATLKVTWDKVWDDILKETGIQIKT